MRERRGVARRLAPDPFARIAQVHAAPAYDLIVSLRALYNPRTYAHTRTWATLVRERLDPALYERGRFFFQGGDTALGYGALRLAPGLPSMAEPEALIDLVCAADPCALALRMLDTGETGADALAAFHRALGGAAAPGASPADANIEAALHDLPPQWARRCRRVLADPAGVKADLVGFLEQYHASVFVDEVPHLREPLERARAAADELLGVLPTVDAIDRLTGGYTLGEDLALRRVTLAPSVFIYPFMSSRVDEAGGEALIVYGVRSTVFLKYEQVPLDPGLVGALRALADPGRLKVVRLLGRGPLYTTELVSALRLSQPTVHHHLAQLRAAGLVRQERTKGGMRFTIRAEAAAATLHALERLLSGTD